MGQRRPLATARPGALAGAFVPALVAVVWAALLPACASLSGQKQAEEERPPPPPVYANMPLEKALEAGIEYGGDTLADVKRLVKRRNEGQAAGKLLVDALHRGFETYGNSQLLNAGHLYVAMPVPVAVPIFRELVASPKPLARQLGWQLAAMKPDRALAKAIDAELSRALSENDEEQVLMPQMANAVRANHLKGAYTLIREGLMTKGDEEFAQAMIGLDSTRASDDFLSYLALAPAEELRQLTMSSVNLLTCITILRQMQTVAPSPGAPNFEHLFDYAVSRNTALADLAETVIETYVPARTDLMAQILARHPAWVQIAFLENARRKMDTKVGLLLGELKKTTAESDVVQEIDEIRF